MDLENPEEKCGDHDDSIAQQSSCCDAGSVCGINDTPPGVGASAPAPPRAAPTECDGECLCSERAFFFLLFGFYMLSLVIIAVYGRLLAPTHLEKGDADETPANERGADNDGNVSRDEDAQVKVQKGPSPAHLVLMDHFMPRAGFGSVVISLTLFSTLFSGYSVIGIPDDTFKAGFFGLRWLASTLPGITAMMIFYPRFRRVGMARNYASPSDVFADRFNCQALRLLATAIMLFVQLIYTAAQFKAIFDIIDAIALGRIDAYETTAFIMVVTVVCDWIGGQRGVTLSDSLQAAFTLISSFTMPLVLVYQYRPLSELMSECQGNNCISTRRPWFMRTPTVLGTCLLKESATDSDCFRSTFSNSTQYQAGVETWGLDPDEFTIFDHQTISIIGFIMNGFAFPVQTHFLQKLFLARSEAVLRYAMLFLSVSAFIVFLPSFYYGLLAAADFSDETTTAVPMLAGKLMDLGGFRQFIAIISLNAVIATIMSTADSTVIGGTNIWVCTWVKGFLWPNQSGRAYRWVTYITTPVIAYSAMTFAVHASDVRFDTLISIQNSINWQAIPAFVVALYSDRIAAYPLLFGMISGLTVTLTIEVLQALDHNDNVHHYHRHKFDSFLPSGIWGVSVNVAVAIVSQIALSRMGSSLADDSRRTFDTLSTSLCSTYGPSRLTVDEISRIVAGSPEPMMNPFRRKLAYAQCAILLFAMPWYKSAYTEQQVAEGGFPEWAAWLFAAIVLCYAIQIFCIWTWAPNDAPIVGLHYGGEEMEHPDRFRLDGPDANDADPDGSLNEVDLSDEVGSPTSYMDIAGDITSAAASEA